jgi:4,4'-diaponeurosporenoate glycosyltransferase
MIDGFTLLGWSAGWLVAGRARQLPEVRTPGSPPRVSVVVPARNEAARLPALLSALDADATDCRPHEVIVVDDSSTDGTDGVARAAGATIIRTAPPPGWAGKCWACWQGARATSGEVVVFLDADTEPAPGFVGRLAAAAVASDGLVSVQPAHRVERPYEHLSAVCNVVALMAGTGRVPPPRRRPGRWWRGPVGFGPALAVPRQRYFAAGGHARVRAAVAEDMALAGEFDRVGIPVAAFVAGSNGGIRYRMYPEGPAALWRGWSKNLAAGAGRVPIVRVALVAVWIAAGLRAAGRARNRPGAYALYGLQAGLLFRRAGAFHPLLGLIYPLPLAAFVALTGRSVLSRAGWSVQWRGRLVRS